MQPEPPSGGTGPAGRFRPVIDLEDGTVVGVETRSGPSPAELARDAAAWVDHLRVTGPEAPDLFLTPAPALWARADAAVVVRHVLVAAGLEAAHVVMTVQVPDPSVPAARLDGIVARLAGLGMRVALGGLGATMPVALLAGAGATVIRLDPAVAARAAVDDRGATLLAHLVAAAHAVGLDTVADGLDDPASLAAARLGGARFGVGSVIGDPVRPWSLDLDPFGGVEIDLTEGVPAPTLSRSPTIDR